MFHLFSQRMLLQGCNHVLAGDSRLAGWSMIVFQFWPRARGGGLCTARSDYLRLINRYYFSGDKK
ncbi:MAG: hypothetical protein PF483_15835 [Halothiobacillus sp.]|nr:hypothetical protein [Halothiobacillus sp.]